MSAPRDSARVTREMSGFVGISTLAARYAVTVFFLQSHPRLGVRLFLWLPPATLQLLGMSAIHGGAHNAFTMTRKPLAVLVFGAHGENARKGP